MKGQQLVIRLRFALNGLILALRRESSLRFQITIAAGVLAVLWATDSPPLWWALGFLSIGLVLVAELFNTALEAWVDHLHPNRHPEVGAVKDIAAGAVLVASAIALAVAVAYCYR